MLKIFKDLAPFFNDCYRTMSISEYAKERGITPPTASSWLSAYHDEGLLARETDRNAILYTAKRDSRDFRDLSRMYWRQRLLPLIQKIREYFVSPAIVLYGSLAKAEVTRDSDVDLAIFAVPKDVDLGKTFFGRELHIFVRHSLNDVSVDLRNSILNGYVLAGRLQL